MLRTIERRYGTVLRSLEPARRADEVIRPAASESRSGEPFSLCTVLRAETIGGLALPPVDAKPRTFAITTRLRSFRVAVGAGLAQFSLELLPEIRPALISLSLSCSYIHLFVLDTAEAHKNDDGTQTRIATRSKTRSLA